MLELQALPSLGPLSSPAMGTQQSLQAPESLRGPGPSPWQSDRPRMLSGSRCGWAASGLVPGEPSGLRGCWAVGARGGWARDEATLEPHTPYFNLFGLSTNQVFILVVCTRAGS